MKRQKQWFARLLFRFGLGSLTVEGVCGKCGKPTVFICRDREVFRRVTAGKALCWDCGASPWEKLAYKDAIKPLFFGGRPA